MILSDEVVQMIHTKSSAAIWRECNSISELCKRSGESMYPTESGEGDLVVMDIEAFARRESMLRLSEGFESGGSCRQTMREPGGVRIW